MSTLFIIRHAQGSFGSGNYDRLSETGEKQAVILAEHFRNINMNFDEIYSGTMERHIKTAHACKSAYDSAGLPFPEIMHDIRLNEYDAEAIMRILMPVLLSEQPVFREHFDRIFEDKKSFQILFNEIINMWCSGNYDMNGTATWAEFISGVYGFVDERMSEHSGNKNIALFTSGGPISALIMKVLSLNLETTMLIRDRIVNSSITRFKYTEHRIMISSFNEYSHLELSGGKNIVTYR